MLYINSLGDVVNVELLIADGGNVNFKYEDGSTLLELAVKNSTMIWYWIEFIQSINSIRIPIHRHRTKSPHSIFLWTDFSSKTIKLYKLFVADDEKLVKILIKAEANVNARNDDEFTPLHFAAQNGKSISEIHYCSVFLNNAKKKKRLKSVQHLLII